MLITIIRDKTKNKKIIQFKDLMIVLQKVEQIVTNREWIKVLM